MDRISKALQKLSPKEREELKSLLERVKRNELADLDVKKLKGKNNIFRARKGRIRVIFAKQEDGNINILAVERRSDNTYRF
jgi:mRNA-degrading endonuclease RelE of RelBE toxin-antitoxin system